MTNARHNSAEVDIALHDGEFNVLQLDSTTRQDAETQNSQLQRPVAEFPALGEGIYDRYRDLLDVLVLGSEPARGSVHWGGGHFVR